MSDRSSDGNHEIAARRRLVAAAQAERRGIERALHDGPQQHLVSMAVKLRLAESAVDEDPDGAKAQMAELRGEVQEVIQHLRELAHAVYPSLLDDRGAVDALRSAGGRARLPITIDVADGEFDGLDPDLAAAVYFTVVDALAADQRADGHSDLWLERYRLGLRFHLTGPRLPVEMVATLADRLAAFGGLFDVDLVEGEVVSQGIVPLPAPT